MKYIIIDSRTNKIICFRGGYTTRQGAENGRYSLCSEIFNEAIKYVREIQNLPPGSLFSNAVHKYVEENSSIIEVSEIIYKTAEGVEIRQII